MSSTVFSTARASNGLGASSLVMCHMFEHVFDLREALSAITQSLPAQMNGVLACQNWKLGSATASPVRSNFEHGIYLPGAAAESAVNDSVGACESTELVENHTIFMAFVRGPWVRADTGTFRCSGDLLRIFKTFRRAPKRSRACSIPIGARRS